MDKQPGTMHGVGKIFDDDGSTQPFMISFHIFCFHRKIRYDALLSSHIPNLRLDSG